MRPLADDQNLVIKNEQGSLHGSLGTKRLSY